MTIFELITQFSRYRRRINDINVVQMCGLKAGITARTLKTTKPIVFFGYNQQIEYPATDNISVTACLSQAISSFCYYLVSLDLNSLLTVTKGVDNTYALPSTPSGGTPIGSLKITTDATHTFTCGTDSFTASGITTDFFDIDCGMALSLINQAQSHLERGVTIIRHGIQRTISDFDHMQVRATVSLSQGDSSVVLPFPNFKAFQDNGINITDNNGITYPVEREDSLPIGFNPIQVRPVKISRRITTETVFTSDGYPGMSFSLWPTCDQSYTLDIQAFQYSPAIDGVIYQRNWLTDNAFDILLFGALVESALLFGADAQSKEWDARWQEAVWTLHSSQEKAKISGSYIYTKFPNPLIKKGTGTISNKQGIMSYGFIN